MTEKIYIEIGFAELNALMTHHWDIYHSINKLSEIQQDRMTLAGWPLKQTADNHLARYRELEDIRDNTWGK